MALAEMPLDDRCAATRTCVLALRGSSHCIRKPFRGRQRNRKPAGGPAERVSRPGACRHSAPRLVCCHLCAIADCCITRARERAHERGPALQARAVVGNVFLSPNGCRRAGTARFKAAMKCQYSPALRAKKHTRQFCVCLHACAHARNREGHENRLELIQPFCDLRWEQRRQFRRRCAWGIGITLGLIALMVSPHLHLASRRLWRCSCHLSSLHAFVSICCPSLKFKQKR